MTRPLLLGHRGARAFRQIPENTLASFEACLQHGCDGFEFDVRLSADRQAVICHDATIAGLAIANSPADRLALPTLDDVLRTFAGRAFLDIELKVAGLEALTLASLLKHPPKEGFVVSSFLPEVLAAIHDLDPTIPLGFLCETANQLRCWRQMPAEWIIPRLDLVNRNLIELIHGARKRVMVWTVNGAESMHQHSEWGVDAIISDETNLLARSIP